MVAWQCPKMEAQSWVPQQKGSMGHTDGEMGWRVEGLDGTDDANTASQGRCHQEPARVDETASGYEGGVQRTCADPETKGSASPSTLEHWYLVRN